MAVHIRLTRVGATKRPSYRVIAIDSRRSRDGRALEILGYYDPLTDPVTVKLDDERIASWMARGAKPSDAVARLMKVSSSPSGAAVETRSKPARAPRKPKKVKEPKAPAPVVEEAAPAVEAAEDAAPAAAEDEALAEAATEEPAAEPAVETEAAAESETPTEPEAPSEATAEPETPAENDKETEA